MFSGIAWLRRPGRVGSSRGAGERGRRRRARCVRGRAAAGRGRNGPPAQAPDEARAGRLGRLDVPVVEPAERDDARRGHTADGDGRDGFATSLQVALGNSDGCPVTSAAAGIPVTFSAPSSGASGVFSSSESNTAVVGADAAGTVAAPPFTANTAAGSYTVTATSQYGSVSFSLTNTAAGIWCSTLGRRAAASAGER